MGGLGDEPVAYGQRHGFRAAGDAQFGEDVADVGFDGRRADDQPLGDLGVVQTFDHQRQYGTLALRQVVARRWRLAGGVDQCLGSLGRQGGAAGVRRASTLRFIWQAFHVAVR